MLESISIGNLGLISDADIEFHPGLVVITGETGAGKTLLLEAIGALAGGKPGLAGATADTTVDASLRVESEWSADVSDMGAALEGDSVLISRVFPREGKARTVLGGRPVPAASLAALAENWLAVHGQHDTLRLLKPNTHRELLDLYGGSGVAQANETFRSAFNDWRSLTAELNKAKRDQAELLANAESIRADLQVLQALAPQPGEDIEIAARIERLARTEQLRQAVGFAVDLIAGEDSSITSQLSKAGRELEHAISGDAQIDALIERIRAARSELDDAAGELAGLLDSLDIEPAALDALMMRQRQLKSLLLRHGPNLDDLLDWQVQAERQLALVDPDGRALAALEAAVNLAEKTTRAAAAELSRLRRQAAAELSSAVSGEIKDLALPFARFEVAVEDAQLNETGADRVEFQFSANPGLPLQPIGQSASGGELSRLMLAIEVCLQGERPAGGPSVLVFDEVDAGVAGAAATSVAQRLSRLARHRQVLVVSHLPQIAAFADQHLKVEKDSDGLVTNTTIISVEDGDRVTEIARMLAGVERSEAAKSHAAELMVAARKEKQKRNVQ